MIISDLLKKKGQFVSLEFFPPKERKLWPAFFEEVEKLEAVSPLFVSVTYGAGGGTQAKSLELVTRLKKDHGQEPMAHLTCVGATEEQLHKFIQGLGDAGIENVLALGGDPPAGDEKRLPRNPEFRYASDLVQFIKTDYPDICIGVAGYPEKHIKSETMEADLDFLKQKLEFGGDFVITQLFFDNNFYFDFVKRARAIGIESKIIPGVMPVFNLNVIKKVTSLCGATIPEELLNDLESAHENGGAKAVEKVGVLFAKKQVRDLVKRGAPGVHLYTLNKAGACLEIVKDME